MGSYLNRLENERRRRADDNDDNNNNETTTPLVGGLQQHFVTEIDLRGIETPNSLTMMEMNALTDAIMTTSSTHHNHNHLKSIDLSRSIKDDPNVIANFINNVVAVHPTLIDLNLSYNGLTDAHATMIGCALKQNKTLKIMNLGYNNINADGATALATTAIRTNTSLEDLILNNNNIGSKGCRSICGALVTNKDKTSVRGLYLNSNNITDDGCVSIVSVNDENDNESITSSSLSDVIRSCRSVVELSLTNNKIGDTSMRDIANSIRHNSTLCELHLGNNPLISSYGVALLITSLKSSNNCSLVALHVHGGRVCSSNNNTHSGTTAMTASQRDTISNFCRDNIRLKHIYDDHIVHGMRYLPLHLYPNVIEKVSSKPDYIMAILQSKPDWFHPYPPPPPPTHNKKNKNRGFTRYHKSLGRYLSSFLLRFPLISFLMNNAVNIKWGRGQPDDDKKKNDTKDIDHEEDTTTSISIRTIGILWNSLLQSLSSLLRFLRGSFGSNVKIKWMQGQSATKKTNKTTKKRKGRKGASSSTKPTGLLLRLWDSFSSFFHFPLICFLIHNAKMKWAQRRQQRHANKRKKTNNKRTKNNIIWSIWNSLLESFSSLLNNCFLACKSVKIGTTRRQRTPGVGTMNKKQQGQQKRRHPMYYAFGLLLYSGVAISTLWLLLVYYSGSSSVDPSSGTASSSDGSGTATIPYIPANSNNVTTVSSSMPLPSSLRDSELGVEALLAVYYYKNLGCNEDTNRDDCQGEAVPPCELLLLHEMLSRHRIHPISQHRVFVFALACVVSGMKEEGCVAGSIQQHN